MRSRILWLFLLALSVVPFTYAQSMDTTMLGGSSPVSRQPSDTNPLSVEKVLPAADAARTGYLPLVDLRHYERPFEKQKVAIEVMRFPSRALAFSAYSFLQDPGAKPFEGMVDTAIHRDEVLLWKQDRVVRSRFPRLSAIRLSSYITWIRGQFGEPAPAPSSYLRLPELHRASPGRRYLVKDSQLLLLFPEWKNASLGLDQGASLSLCRYHGKGGDYWAGWMEQGRPSPGPLPEGLYFVTRTVSGRLAFYLGPDLPGLREEAFQALSSASEGQDLDLGRFFRREYSYGDVILGGFKMVFFCLFGSALVGIVLGLIYVGCRRLLGRGHGLDEETVGRLYLDGAPLSIVGKEERGPSETRSSSTTDSSCGSGSDRKE